MKTNQRTQKLQRQQRLKSKYLILHLDNLSNHKNKQSRQKPQNPKKHLNPLRLKKFQSHKILQNRILLQLLKRRVSSGHLDLCSELLQQQVFSQNPRHFLENQLLLRDYLEVPTYLIKTKVHLLRVSQEKMMMTGMMKLKRNLKLFLFSQPRITILSSST